MLINCYDKGLYNLVTGMTQSDIIVEAPITDRVVLEVYDTLVYETIQELFLQGKQIKIPKGLSVISVADLIIEENNELEITRNSAEVRIMNFVNKRIGTVYNYHLFTFNLLNNYMITQGIIITEENSNMKYLEILQSENQDLINNLEKFLEVKSKIDEYTTLFNDSQLCLNNIDESQSIDEIEGFINNFISSWN